MSARSPIVAYGLAVVAVAVAWGARWLLDPVLGDELPFFTFYFAVLFASWRWGLGPGLASLALGIVVGDYFFEAPRQTLGATALVDRFDTLRFAVVGVCVSAICEALHRQRRAAEMRRELLRVTLASIADAVITTDALGRVTFLNPVAEQLTGWTQAEAEGQALELVFRIVNEETRRAVESPATRALREGLVVGLANHTILMRRDGTECAIDDSAAPIRDDLGDVSGCVLTFRDISERRRTELRIEALMTELRAADRSKDEFLAVLAHELRNPLSPIANAARVLGVRAPVDPVVARARDVIERQVAHLAHLVDDLLDVSRITRGKIALRRERVDVGPLAADSAEMHREAIDAAGVALAVCPPDEPLVVDGDPTRLSQVVQNLVANAVKFTPRGGRVEVATRREESEVVLRVRDTGIGIAADMLEAIFEPFVQSERSPERTGGGLGIGLTIAKRLVELHGGTIEATSDGLGRGCEIVVRLPQAESRDVVPMAPQASAGAARRRILVADDHQDSVEMLVALLRLKGHEVHSARDGAEALRLAEEQRPEVVLLDLGMPGVNGYDCCRRLRAAPWGKALRVFALSGWGQEEDRRRSREAGFDGHMVKPLDERALAELLRENAAGA